MRSDPITGMPVVTDPNIRRFVNDLSARGVGSIVVQYQPDPNTERERDQARWERDTHLRAAERARQRLAAEHATRVRLERKLQSRRSELRNLSEIRRYEHETELVLAKALSDIVQRPDHADEIAGAAVLEWIRRRGPRADH